MSSSANPSVLILDRDSIHRQRLENALREHAYQVSSEADGRAGLYHIDQRPPTLLISALELEHVDGLSLVRALQTRPETQAVKVIFMSAQDDRETMLQALQLGAKFFLPKPVSLDEVLEKVERALREEREE